MNIGSHSRKLKDPRTVRIGISGSYGGFNLGDESILQSIISGLRSHLNAEITVFTRDKEDTLTRQDVDRAVAFRILSRQEITPEIERLDFFILGGGGILYDADAKMYLREVTIAREFGIPVMIFAISAGPLNNPAIQELVRKQLEEVQLITVRDRPARHILESVGIRREIHITADPALLIHSVPVGDEILQKEGLDSSRRKIGISVREQGTAAPDIDEERYHQILANAADFMIDRFDGDIIFIPMERKARDLQQSHAVISKMLRPQHARVLQGKYTSNELLGIISNLSFCIGMRLHFLIYSALQKIPFVGLPYSPKVNGFLEDMHLDMPPVQLVNAGRVIAYIDGAWDHREDVKSKIETIIPQLQQRARKNFDLAMGLLKDTYKNLPTPEV